MANLHLRICWDHHIDGGVVSSSTAFAALPATNVQNADIQRIWRAMASPAWLVGDVAQTLTLGVVALINTNLVPGDTVQIRTSLTNPGATDSLTYDSGAMIVNTDPRWRRFVHFIPTPVLYRYVRVDLFQSVSTPSVGRFVTGDVWQPTHDMSFGWEPLWRDLSTRSKSLGGNEFVDVRPRQRGYRFTVKGLTEDEAQTHVDELNRIRGIGRDVLVCRDVTADNLGRATVWGLLEEPVRQRQDHLDYYAFDMEVYDRV